MFFGTPFRGRAGHDLKVWIDKLEDSHQKKHEKSDKPLPPLHIWPETMSTSVPGNLYLQEMVEQFGETRRGIHPIPLWCFYEVQPSPVGKMLGDESWPKCYVVPQESACYDVSRNVYRHSLPRHHYNLPKFPDADDEAWKAVRTKIEPLIAGAKQFLDERSKGRSSMPCDIN